MKSGRYLASQHRSVSFFAYPTAVDTDIILWCQPPSGRRALNFHRTGRPAVSILRPLALLFALALWSAPANAQDGKIKIEKFNHSEWTKGIFSEAVTVTNVGNAKFVYLAGVGAEDENGQRGTIKHPGDFLEQCKYAYDK